MNKRVMFVDDEDDLRELVRQELKTLGCCELALCAGAEEAKVTYNELIRTCAAPDVIFCDLAMPKVDGFTLIRWLREQEEINGIPRAFIVAVSAYEREVAQSHMLDAADIDDYIVKPFEIEEFVRHIRQEVVEVAEVLQHEKIIRAL